MISDKLRADGELTIKVVDKNTGKVVNEVKQKNDLASGFSSGICGELAGESDVLLGAIDTVGLYNSAGGLIKELTPPLTREHRMYTDHDDVHVHFEDASSDVYTVATARMESSYGTTVRQIAFKTGLNVAKAADQKLVVDWVINVYFAT